MYLYTNNNTLEDTRMPSLENWDGGLNGYIYVYLVIRTTVEF